MNRQIYFLINKDKEKTLFDHIESSLNCKFYPYFISEDLTLSIDVFLIVPCEYEKDVKYVDVNENIKGKKIYPFDESLNMIPAIEYSHEDFDCDDGILCRIYLNYDNIHILGKKKIKHVYDYLHKFIKSISRKTHIEGMPVYRLNNVI